MAMSGGGSLLGQVTPGWKAPITVLGNPFSYGSSAVSERMDLRRNRDRGRPTYWLAVAASGVSRQNVRDVGHHA